MRFLSEFGRFLPRDVHQVIIHETRVWVIVFGVHEAETVLFIERYSIQIGVHRQEAAAGFVLGDKHPFDVIQHS